MIKIFVASDHAGIDLKTKILTLLTSAPYHSQYEVHDLGPFSTDSVDYPDYADLVCRKMHGFTLIDTHDQRKSHPTELGILICGSGQGMAIRANRFNHIRAALCWTPEVAKLSREHNDANVLCMGSRLMDHELCLQIVHTFLKTPFAGGRHLQRVVKLSQDTQ